MKALLQRKWPSVTETRIDGRLVAVAVRVSSRAHSYRLSIPHGGTPVLTVPKYGRWPEAEAFLSRQNAWLAARLKRAAKPVSLADGAIVPLRGVEHRIVATGSLRGRVRAVRAEGEKLLHVPGEPAHQTRRLMEWLKAEAKRDLELRVAVHASALRVKVKSVAMRNQSTRWGSCSTTGRLNFNWRLVLAPPFVLDYVAAHEVANLVEMNHSQAFWDTVERTLPDMARGRAWLKAHGRQLMVYGLEV